MKYKLAAHKRGSDYYDDRKHPGFTLWPYGTIIDNISRAEARVIERALNAALRSGELSEDGEARAVADALESMGDDSIVALGFTDN
jgi:hypothetical protein